MKGGFCWNVGIAIDYFLLDLLTSWSQWYPMSSFLNLHVGPGFLLELDQLLNVPLLRPLHCRLFRKLLIEALLDVCPNPPGLSSSDSCTNVFVVMCIHS